MTGETIDGGFFLPAWGDTLAELRSEMGGETGMRSTSHFPPRDKVAFLFVRGFLFFVVSMGALHARRFLDDFDTGTSTALPSEL